MSFYALVYNIGSPTALTYGQDLALELSSPSCPLHLRTRTRICASRRKPASNPRKKHERSSRIWEKGCGPVVEGSERLARYLQA